MKHFYLLAAVLGAVVPWWYNLRALEQLGSGFTPQAFFLVGFQGSALLGSVAADFWIGSTVALAWMVAEARRLQMRRWWVFVIWTFAIAWASALPLFLYFRERHLERSLPGTATVHCLPSHLHPPLTSTRQVAGPGVVACSHSRLTPAPARRCAGCAHPDRIGPG
jgi:hypothetical protein